MTVSQFVTVTVSLSEERASLSKSTKGVAIPEGEVQSRIFLNSTLIYNTKIKKNQRQANKTKTKDPLCTEVRARHFFHS